MMLTSVSPRIFIVDALLGWDVLVVPEMEEGGLDDWFDDQEFARCYARGLSLGSGWPIIDFSTLAPKMVPLAESAVAA